MKTTVDIMLTKSYIDMRDSDNPPLQDRVLYDLFARVRKAGRITQFVSMETNERVNSEHILDEVYIVLNTTF